jgi:Protein of unknown function (DUF3298)
MKQFLKKLMLCVICAGVLYLVWVYMVGVSPDFGPTPKLEDKVFDSKAVSIRLEKSIETNNVYVIDIFTPVVSGSISPLVFARINSTIKSEIDAVVSDFKKEHEEISSLEKKPTVIENDGIQDKISETDDSSKNTLSISLGAHQVIGDRYLNLQIAEFSYNAGSAHPLTSTVSYNFDLQDGREVLLDTLFNSDTQYLVTLATLVKEKLRTQLRMKSFDTEASTTSAVSGEVNTEESLSTVFFEEGADPRDENYKQFVIEKEGIRFLFGQYQVAPYVYGEQSVLVEYSVLGDILNSRFKEKVALF